MREILWRIQKETRSDEILFRLLVIMARECDHRGRLDLTATQIGKMAGVASKAVLKERISMAMAKGLLAVKDGQLVLDLQTPVFASGCQFKIDVAEDDSAFNSDIDRSADTPDHSSTALRSGSQTTAQSSSPLVATLPKQITKVPLPTDKSERSTKPSKTTDLPGHQGDSDSSSSPVMREPRSCNHELVNASELTDGVNSKRGDGLNNDPVRHVGVDELFLVDHVPAPVTRSAWQTYRQCQQTTHSYDPPSSAKANSLMLTMAKELGIDELVMLIQYYHTRTDQKYVVNRHPLNLLRMDQHRLHADMTSGGPVSQGEARTMDRVQSAKAAAERAKGMMR